MLMGILRKVVKDVVVPELKQIRADHTEIKTTLQLTNKRLDDINAHLIDLSRRIDETNQHIDALHVDLVQRIDTVNADLIQRIDKTNDRLNRLYEVIVRRDEHEGLNQRLTRLEQKFEDFTARNAA